MPIRDIPGLRFENYRAGTAGNAQIKPVALAQDRALVAGDAYRLLKIHPGMRIDNIVSTIHDAPAGTVDIGYVRGETDASGVVAAGDGDVDYFLDGQDFSAVGVQESRWRRQHKPLQVPYDGYLVIKFNAAQAANVEFDLTFHIEFEFVGNL